MHQEFVTVIIPAYNEERIIQRLVQDTLTAMNTYTKYFEVLVIDDGSNDRTLEKARAIRDPHLRVIQNEKNMGKTKTLLHGLATVKGDIVSFIDADYQYDPRDLPKVIETVKRSADLCGGYRTRRQDSPYRRFMSMGFNTFDRLLFGIQIRDVNCGLKAFRKKSFEAIHLRYLSTKWFIDTEILARYYHKGYIVAEVPIHHYERSEGISKVNGIKLAMETFVYGIMLKWDLMVHSKRSLPS